jgi:hypothetical protein
MGCPDATARLCTPPDDDPAWLADLYAAYDAADLLVDDIRQLFATLRS